MTIYVYCPEGPNPPPGGIIAGGAQMLYRFVDVLNNNGFDAYMLHQNPGFKCGWFEHETKIAYLSQVSMDTSDFLVLPEALGPKAADNARGVKKVIYNQNCFLSFNGFSFDNKVFDTPYLDDEVVAVMTVSEHSREYLRYVFPDIKIYRIHYGIEPSTFPYIPFKEKKKLISFMPRKLIGDILQVVNILKFRGKLENYELAVIDKMNQGEVSKILGESMIYLSSSSYEGFGLPPCGGYVEWMHCRRLPRLWRKRVFQTGVFLSRSGRGCCGVCESCGGSYRPL